MDLCDPMGIEPLNTYTENFIHDEEFHAFYDFLNNGSLPHYTFLIPRMEDHKGLLANS